MEALWWCGRVGTRKKQQQVAAGQRTQPTHSSLAACSCRTGQDAGQHACWRCAGVLSAGQDRLCRHGDH